MFYSLPGFRYYRARSLEEALELLSSHSGAAVLAGGTDLLNDMRDGRRRPRVIVDIGGLRELSYIIDDGSVVRIGALTRLQEILGSRVVAEKLPLLHRAVYNMASWQIRNMATVGGNLCNASPAADTAPPLMVHEAVLRLVSRGGSREVPVTGFFWGPRDTVRGDDEILVEIRVPVLRGYGFSYRKLGRRSSFTLSIVSVASAVRIEDGVIADARIALNSVAPTPVRARSVEEALRGASVSRRAIEEAASLVENDISPITDVRASAEYRSHVSRVLVRDTLVEACRSLGYSV